MDVAGKVQQKIAAMSHWVSATVHQQVLYPVQLGLVNEGLNGLQALLRALKKLMSPSDATTLYMVRSEYRAHLASAKQARVSPSAWLSKWKSLYL